MIKNELATKLAEYANLEKYQAAKAIDALMEIMAEALIGGDTIFLRGFGTFKISHHKERVARNITAGTTVTIPARKVVKFIPSSKLKIY